MQSHFIVSILVLVVVLVARVHGGGGGAASRAERLAQLFVCGTNCSVHNFACVTPGIVRDMCGNTIDASTCAIPSCADYCQATYNEARGSFCNDRDHRCECIDTSVSLAQQLSGSKGH